ncbi:MAG: hypothetical protein ACP5KV_03120 [Candidatus Methanomethylicaceae archaeon]
MDATWLTLFLPFAVIFALVFAMGILLFIFYDLVKISNERHSKRTQSISDGSHNDFKKTNLRLSRFIGFLNKKGGTLSHSAGIESSTLTNDIKSTSVEVNNVSTEIAKNNQPTSLKEEIKPKIEALAPATIEKTPTEASKDEGSKINEVDVKKSEATRVADATQKVNVKQAQTLSEVEEVLKRKAGYATSTMPPSENSKTIANSEDVLSLLGGVVAIQSEDQNKKDKIENLEVVEKLKDDKVKNQEPLKTEKSESNSENATASPKEDLEVLSILKREEPVDVAKDLPKQFAELKSSIFLLRQKLKDMASNEEVENQDPKKNV